jgi:putative hemolysin
MDAPAPSDPEFRVGKRVLARLGSRDAYTVRLVADEAELKAAQRLRFEVFNVEMHEGLAASYETGLDADPFDAVCDHLVVFEKATERVVGTYRLQTGPMAAANRGYYSAQEFDFMPFEPMRKEIVELGRACVHADHRNVAVLGLLWREIGNYARARDARYLVGCSSITSQDPVEGATMYRELSRKNQAQEKWRTVPLPGWECPLDRMSDAAPKVPKLLTAYLALSARICGPPAIDREFKTIDFLTVLDLKSIPVVLMERFLR